MNKLLTALVAAMAFAALPTLASPASTSANGQTVVTSGLPTGTVVAQSSDSNDQNQGQSPTAPAPQSDDNDK